MNNSSTSKLPRSTGVVPCQGLEALIRDGEIHAAEPVRDDQIQPASLDLRLGHTAIRLRSSFLPGKGRTVLDALQDFAMHEVDISNGAVLETGCVYLVPLMESLDLSERIAAMANPKSSTGRIDVFTRLICDGASVFDKVEAGYSGPLYAEISPRTFSILVRPGSRLNQLRLCRGTFGISDAEVRRLHERETLIDGEVNIDGGVACTVDLLGREMDGLVGYRARRHAGLIDVDKPGSCRTGDYWEPVYAENSMLVLDPDEFYILATKEAIHIPPDYAAEMVAYDTSVGEFRVHYAGFFDPGFGHSAAGGAGSRLVLEVRSHDVPFALMHGQVVGRFIYEHMTERPSVLYGEGIGSNYQQQGLKLSKHFRD